jgi:hypothetical protein
LKQKPFENISSSFALSYSSSEIFSPSLSDILLPFTDFTNITSIWLCITNSYSRNLNEHRIILPQFIYDCNG